jgi:HSP20 family protein
MGGVNMFGLTPYNRRNRGLTNRDSIWGKDGILNVRGFFEDFFNDPFFTGLSAAVNPVKADIRENEKEYLIEAELPGVKKEDIKLDLRDDVLTISVENNIETNEERDNYIRRERRYGSFSRSFYVENTDHEAITAKYNDGILSIKLPKSEEARKKGYNIDIQ